MLGHVGEEDVARSIGSLVFDLPNSREVGECMYPLLGICPSEVERYERRENKSSFLSCDALRFPTFVERIK